MTTDTWFASAPLSKEKTEKLGHIAWIESDDPQAAIAGMVETIKTPTKNCAIWTNAGARRNPDRPLPAIKSASPNSPTIYTTGDSSDTYESRLSEYFTNTAALTERKSQIVAAIAPLKIELEVRNATINCHEPVDDHVDGHDEIQYYFPLNGPRGFRLIETLSGKTTHIFSNRDATKTPRGRSSSKWGIPPIYNLIRDGRAITGWSVPEDSLTLLTHLAHTGRPIVHSYAFIPANRNGIEEQDLKRVVAVYNITLDDPYGEPNPYYVHRFGTPKP